MNITVSQGRIFAIYKPKGITSHDVVNAVRTHTGEKRVGHAGTLDPLAEGVLVIGVGREATKKLAEVVKKEKEYMAEITLGVTSTTDDEEGEKTEQKVARIPTREDIENVVESFSGAIQQVPPVYSAVKIKGEEAYKRVRRGEEVTLKPRAVEVKEIEILKYEFPLLKLRVVTGPGVYIRGLARDIGEKLGVGGYCSQLKRTRVGNFLERDAVHNDWIASCMRR